MRRILLILTSLAGALGVAVHASPPQAGAPSVPVVVELFTSEGCSSCPPADAWLIDLATHAYVPGAQIITLSEHVDYWDHDGWRDPFSSASFTARQNAYVQRAVGVEAATPQMVVDGTAIFIGSDRRAAIDAITKAAATPKAQMTLAWSPAATPTVTIAVPASAVTAKASVVVAVTEDGLQSNVLRGENAGHTIAHTSVTRRLSDVGHTSSDGSFKLDLPVRIDNGWNRQALRLVAFVQSSTRRVVAAGSLRVADAPAR
jgi:hypothetical protein